jgi:hypothetical protein
LKGDEAGAVRKYEKCCKYITMLRDSMGSTNDEEETRNHLLTILINS